MRLSARAWQSAVLQFSSCGKRDDATGLMLHFDKLIHTFSSKNGGKPDCINFRGEVLNKKVLIIDDEDFLRSFYSHYFVKNGFIVLEADNGLDGVAVAEAEKPELILLDLIMPGMHGFAVCKQLRENPALDKTTIIITSSKSYKPDIDKALELGADAYVIKPVEFDELFQIANEKMVQRLRVIP